MALGVVCEVDSVPLTTVSDCEVGTMGIVIQFPVSARSAGSAATARGAALGSGSLRGAVEAAAGAGSRSEVLSAARPLIAECRERFGFSVMADGLPTDGRTLATAILSLHAALEDLAKAPGVSLPIYPGFGVYFGRRRPGWFEDGYGGQSGLAVPNEVDPAQLAALVGNRLRRLGS
ncbi:MAG: hypothetical protein NW205_13050 [Hyphomicrobiaceae bacterium]|nr:hypothetical protein [Hyphomicrobiaceae bacterium]